MRQSEQLTGDPNHTVAAVAMDTVGRIFTAVIDYHFTGGPCAELVVLGVAASEGARPLTTTVAVGDGGRGVIAPCVVTFHLDPLGEESTSSLRA